MKFSELLTQNEVVIKGQSPRVMGILDKFVIKGKLDKKNINKAYSAVFKIFGKENINDAELDDILEIITDAGLTKES
jgi:hypothetical protein